MKRRAAVLALFTVAFTFMAWPGASAEYRGSDLIGNISPESQLSSGSLMDRHPMSAYQLDSHVDVGVTDLDGVAPVIAHWVASQLWSLGSFLMKTVIDLFTWAFSLDLLSGQPGQPGTGALAVVGDAISSLYDNVIGQAWMVAAIIAAGAWGIWKALVQRRYTETVGALGMSVLFVLLALFFVNQPDKTVGEASRWTNQMSLAFLSGTNRGTIDDPEKAKQQVADELFRTLVYDPWTVLQFGGLEHCVNARDTDDDGFPRPVSPHDTTKTTCRDHQHTDRNGFGGYAERFLRQPAGSDERKAEYDALREGEASKLTRQFAGYRVDKADAPAVDIQQQGGAFQRLTVAVVVFVGMLGAIALLGFLSLAVILAQVVALVLLGFAPVVLVLAVFPRGGHELFRSWLAKLATAIFIKALFSLTIAVVVAVSTALTASTGSLGFLFAFSLQAVYFWAILLYRKQITAKLVGATTGATMHSKMPGAGMVQKGALIAASPALAMMASRRGKGGDDDEEKEAGPQKTALTTNPGSPEPGSAGRSSEAAPAPAPTASRPMPERRFTPAARSSGVAPMPAMAGAGGGMASAGPGRWTPPQTGSTPVGGGHGSARAARVPTSTARRRTPQRSGDPLPEVASPRQAEGPVHRPDEHGRETAGAMQRAREMRAAQRALGENDERK